MESPLRNAVRGCSRPQQHEAARGRDGSAHHEMNSQCIEFSVELSTALISPAGLNFNFLPENEYGLGTFQISILNSFHHSLSLLHLCVHWNAPFFFERVSLDELLKDIVCRGSNCYNFVCFVMWKSIPSKIILTHITKLSKTKHAFGICGIEL